MIKKYLSFILVPVLVSCGGNVKDDMVDIDCKSTDWRKIGHETVAANKSVRHFDKYKNYCGDRLEAGAIQEYQNGYAEAAVEVCTEKTGYAYGLKAKKMPEACLFELADIFEKGYTKGDAERRSKIARMREISEEKTTGPTNADLQEQGIEFGR